LEINDSSWTIKSSENIGNIDEGSHEKKRQDEIQFTTKIHDFHDFHSLLNAKVFFCKFFKISPCV
jgi:hypothetical protein